MVVFVNTDTEVCCREAIYFDKQNESNSPCLLVYIQNLGENCDVQSISPRIQDNDPQKGSSTYIFGMILIIMIVCGFFGFLFYHRRKVANLKSVIAHVGVTYNTDNGSIDGTTMKDFHKEPVKVIVR